MILIQCTKTKRNEPAKAKDLYDKSDYFQKMRAYAEAADDEYRILSAKYGLLHPDEKVESYDEFGLSRGQVRTVTTQLVDQDVKTVRICAGQRYKEDLVPELEKEGIDVIELCAGLGIGARKQKLVELRKQAENQTLS